MVRTTKAERKYGKKAEKVVKEKQVKKQNKVSSRVYKILKDNANILPKTFKTLKAATDFINKETARDTKNFIVCTYQIL